MIGQVRTSVLWRQITTVGILLFLIFQATARERVVHIYNWSDYFEKSVIEDFSKETGIKVIYDVFDSNEILETRLLAGGSGYDLVVPSGQFLARQIQAGVFRKLDRSKLPNISFMWELIKEKTQAYDPGNEYSINFMWGTTGIGYNRKKIKAILGVEKIESWDAVFISENLEKLKNCGVYMLNQPQDILPVILNYLGMDPNSRDIQDFVRAENILKSLRPFIRKFSSSEYIDALASGDICLAVGWSGDLLQASNRARESNHGVEISYIIPKEGTEIWFDQMAIPADAKNIDEAHEFINYIMRPDIISRISNHIYYANGNKESQNLIKKEIIENKAIYPDEAVIRTFYTVQPFDQKTQRMVTRLWTRVTTDQ